MTQVQDMTPQVREYGWGTQTYDWGERAFAWGTPAVIVLKPLTPARIIVRAARAIRETAAGAPNGMPAYAVFQPGKPTLPSAIFEAVGTESLENLHGTRPIRMAFQISVRAKLYRDVEVLTFALMNALRRDPSNRVREIGSGISDEYAQNLEFRMRTFQIVIQL